jgi:hypothetical protein
VAELKRLCASQLTSQLRETNCLQYLNLAFKYNLPELKTGAMKVFFTHDQQNQRSAAMAAAGDYSAIPRDFLEALQLL